MKAVHLSGLYLPASQRILSEVVMPDIRTPRPADSSVPEASLRALILSKKNDPHARLWAQAELAEFWRVAGDYRRASLMLRLTLGTAETLYGRNSPEVARLCNQSGVVGKYTGDFIYAERVYHRALTILHRVYGPQHDAVATVYHNLGGLEHSRGHPETGEPWSALSVEIRQSLHGPDHPLVAADIAAWAPLLAGCGRLDEAEMQLRRALKIFEAAGDDYERAVTLHNLAALEQRRGAVREALADNVQALTIKLRLLGGGHPEIAMTLVNLGGLLYRTFDEPDRARRYLKHAVHILVPQVGPDHPTLLKARRTLDSLPC